ncbi:MAG TPA: hypothetical protein VJA94_18380 [Candidatus Angelobacter sp.]
MPRNLRLICAFLVLLSFCNPVVANPPRSAVRSWSGYLIDLACARERKDDEPDLGPKHTKKCMQMPACDRSGFGLLTDANDLLPFDENGNIRVRALLQQTNQTGHLRVVVQGTKTNDVLQVTKIQLKKS